MLMRICIGMNAMTAIRKHVLKVSQMELAEIAKTSQATVSRWEKGELHPDIAQLQRIRTVAADRGIAWDDGWLFDPAPNQITEPAA